MLERRRGRRGCDALGTRRLGRGDRRRWDLDRRWRSRGGSWRARRRPGEESRGRCSRRRGRIRGARGIYGPDQWRNGSFLRLRDRLGCGGRCTAAGRRSNRPRRQERHRVDIAVSSGRDPDPEVDVWRRPFSVRALPGHADGVPFCNLGSLARFDLREVRDGDGVSVGLDRHRMARPRNDSGKRHRPRRGRADSLAEASADVDAPVLSRRVGVGAE
jgi:hypothetical protein